MKNKNLIIVILIAAAAAGVYFFKARPSSSSKDTVRVVKPQTGDIRVTISSPGTVLPKNRLAIKPPVNGRIEEVLVQEGDKVKAGQTLMKMSSSDRAALLDVARGKGQEALKYWQEVYKPISLFSPIDGEVIVGTTQPGQTVTTVDAALVLSDRLIVRAQVDETDIAKIKLGQGAVVTLDAYPDVRLDATVDHVYYESETVNNVTIYKVDLKLAEIPEFFRSGMNTNVDFLIEEKKNVLTIPSEAVRRRHSGATVMVRSGDAEEERAVTLGISDDKNVEVKSGVSPDDEILLKSKKYVLPKSSAGTNPFMPGGNRQQRRQ